MLRSERGGIIFAEQTT